MGDTLDKPQGDVSVPLPSSPWQRLQHAAEFFQDKPKQPLTRCISQQQVQAAHLVPITLKVVIKRQLSARLNILRSKQANSQLTMHDPFLCLTIWVACMVDESPHRTLQNNTTLIVRGKFCLYVAWVVKTPCESTAIFLQQTCNQDAQTWA